jgi:hypothetical protein
MVVEAAVVGLVLYRRVWRTLPVFLVYCIWALVSDGVACGVSLSTGGYTLEFYFADTAIDAVLQFAVFIELAWSVLRPLRSRLSRRGIWVIAAMILVACGVIWPFADIAGLSSPTRGWHLMIQIRR